MEINQGEHPDDPKNSPRDHRWYNDKAKKKRVRIQYEFVPKEPFIIQADRKKKEIRIFNQPFLKRIARGVFTPPIHRLLGTAKPTFIKIGKVPTGTTARAHGPAACSPNNHVFGEALLTQRHDNYLSVPLPVSQICLIIKSICETR